MSGHPTTFAVTKLFRDCLRLADYVASTQGGNRDQLRKTVRHQFKKNATLKDPAAIEAAKETAVRGLSNFMFQEAQRMAKDQTAATAVTKDG